MRRHAHPSFRSALVLSLCCSSPAFAQPSPSPAPAKPAEIPRREFAIDAPKAQTFRWTSQAVLDGEHTIREGINYTWSLPADFNEEKAFDLLVICHPVGKDCTWASATFDRALLGSRIVIAPDGPSAIAKGVRSFRAEDTDVLAFREFLLEITRSFPGDRIFIAGFESGGSFALSFAGNFPGLAEGVVTMSSELWPNTPMKGGVQQVPLVFVHGLADDKTPFRVAQQMRDEYADTGHSMTWLNTRYDQGHEPSAPALARGVDWCAGMVSDDPEKVLDAAKRLLAPAASDRSEMPAFGPACQILRRLLGESENNPAHAPIEEVPATVRAQAKSLIDHVESHAKAHIATVEKDARNESDFVLNGKPWLGHMLALREEFRGVTSVEQFALRSGFDSLIRTQEAHAGDLLTACELKDPKEQFEAVMDQLPTAFARPVLSRGTIEQLRASKERARELTLSEESLERYEMLELIERSGREGLAQYRTILKEWKLEEKAPKPKK